MRNPYRWAFGTHEKQDSKVYPLQSIILDLSRNVSCDSVADVHPRWQTAFCGLRLPLGSFELQVGKPLPFVYISPFTGFVTIAGVLQLRKRKCARPTCTQIEPVECFKALFLFVCSCFFFFILTLLVFGLRSGEFLVVACYHLLFQSQVFLFFSSCIILPQTSQKATLLAIVRLV